MNPIHAPRETDVLIVGANTRVILAAGLLRARELLDAAGAVNPTNMLQSLALRTADRIIACASGGA